LIVIGLDGATWSVIKPNLDKLPAFSKLLSTHKHATLECDVRPVHSAASWTTIFSGLLPEVHGIRDFAMGDTREALLARRIFVWDRIRKGIAMCIPLAIPPINKNYELRGWEAVMLSTTEDEMFASTRKLLSDTIAAIEYGDADLVAVVFSETDRAQHMFWHKPDVLLKHYQSVDRALLKLMPHLDDFLVLSDHGFTDAQETRKNGWDNVRDNQTGGHHPEGIVIAPDEPPRKVSEVCAYIESKIKREERQAEKPR